MKSLFTGLQILLIFSFACHLYMILTPAIDTFGFFGTFLYVLLSTISWVLYLQTQELKNMDKKD
jgi:hypothetical protein